tara:strand:- start:47 stop:832 length:786 start_codon:yes stop_codon:yes gene_type:complete
MSSIPEIHFDSMAALETSYWWHQSRLSWAQTIIVKHFSDPKCLDVLDYGCGTGGFLHQLSERMQFRTCLGVDVDQKAIKEALNYSSAYQQIEENDFTTISNKDLILLMDTLEHVENDEEFLKNIFSEMKMGAHLLISVPAFSRLFSNWDTILGHYRRYEKKNVSQLIQAANGSIQCMEYAFSYLFPVLAFKRKIGQVKYDKHNCEFPHIPAFLNRFLLKLNVLEIFGSSIFGIPFGTSLFCLAKKQGELPVGWMPEAKTSQ